VKKHTRVRRFALLILPSLFLGSVLEISRSAPEVSSSGAPPAAAQAGTMTMGQWREVKGKAEAAMEAPRGDERIARCEAFIEQHPDYPELSQVIRALIEAYEDKRDFDPVRLAALLERLAGDPSQDYSFELPEALVDRYYFKYNLPQESTQRLLKKARSDIAAQKQALARETDSKRREKQLTALEFREAKLELGEGRLLLARGDYAGAISHLIESEAAGLRTGAYGISLQGPEGVTLRGLPLGTPSTDWLNLSLATAYLRTGDRKKALARLGQVQDLLPGFYPEISLARKSLAQELGVPPPAPRDVRAEPKPAADFRLKDLNGNEVSLADFKDRVVLAMFWATW